MKLGDTLTTIAVAMFLTAGCGPAENTGENGGGNGSNGGDGIAEHANVECQDSLCSISGEITEDLTIPNNDKEMLLSGPVFVGDDESETVLTIEPGVTLFAEPGSADNISFLTIRRNSKIMAEGTADEPIVMTTSAEEGERERGLWGGLILNGNAPINVGDTAEGEGNTGTFGGTDPQDDSGVLEYVRVEFAGSLITSENELNGIAFQGVGSETTVDHVQVHMNADDGVEFFGGTVSARHLVLTGIGDDSIDWTDGWQGNIQHAVVHQFDDSGDRGIEADNLEDQMDAEPRSKPTLANLTIIGSDPASEGVLLRRGTGANLHNVIVSGAGGPCLDIDNSPTFSNGWSDGDFSGELTLDNALIHGCASSFADDEEGDRPFTVQEWFEAGDNNQPAEPGIKSTDRAEPDYRVEAGSAADASGSTPGGWFEETDFIGAVGTDTDWTSGWTIHATE